MDGPGSWRACRLRLKNRKRRESFRHSRCVSSPLRLLPRKLFFADRLRVSRATRCLLHNAKQCRSCKGQQRDVGRFHLGQCSVLCDCCLRRLQVLSVPAIECVLRTGRSVTTETSRSCASRSSRCSKRTLTKGICGGSMIAVFRFTLAASLLRHRVLQVVGVRCREVYRTTQRPRPQAGSPITGVRAVAVVV